MRRLRKVGHDPGDQQRKRSADGENHEAKAESVRVNSASLLYWPAFDLTVASS